MQFHDGCGIGACIDGLQSCLMSQHVAMQMPTNKLEAISKQKVKVEPQEILGEEESPALAAAVRQLQRIAQARPDQTSDFMDPLTDFRIQHLELVEKLQERQALIQVYLFDVDGLMLPLPLHDFS